MREIGLSQGYVTTVDDEDYEWLRQFIWHARPELHTCYAGRKFFGTVKLMHSMILNVDMPREIDHVDGNGLNNCRGNLRVVTRQQNCQNRRVLHHSSHYKGVSWRASSGTWRVRITVDDRTAHCGDYENEEAAALAYNQVAKQLFGQFACLNEIHQPQQGLLL